MKRSYTKNVFRTIKSSFSRFLAIFAIVALGVGFLAGLLAAPDDMRLSADTYYDDTNMYDLRVVSSIGLTEDDLALVRQVEGVESVLPVRDMDLVYLTGDHVSLTTRLMTLPEEGDPGINTPVLQSGRLPEKAGECAIVLTKSLTETEDWIGETLTLDQDESEEDAESETEGMPEILTVVGTVKSSAYLSMEQEYTTVGSGVISLVAYTVNDSFDLDYYTGFYLTLKGAKELDAFGEEYEEARDTVTDVLEALGEKRSQVRYQEIVDEANEKLADARKEYEDGKAEADEKLGDAKQELDDAQAEIDDNEKKLADAKQEIEDGKAELSKSRNDYNAQISSAQAQLDNGYAQIKQYQDELDEGMAQIADGQKQLDNGYSQLASGEKELADAKAELDATEQNLTALESGKASFWQLAGQLGLPSEDTSDEATLAAIAQLAILSPEAAEQFAPLKLGLEALSAQGIDTGTARAQLDAGKAEYEKGMEELQASKATLDKNQAELTARKDEAEKQQAALTAQKDELDKSAAALAQTKSAAEAELAAAQKKLDDAQAEYDDGVKQLEDGRQELADGWKEYEDSKAEADAELKDAEEELKDAESKIRDIEEGQWYLFTRDDNAGFSSYASNAEKIAAIAAVFPVFFFLVAALVALTTMTRMVEEERQQIGTMKALGYSTGQIALKYLLYAAIASISGSVFGLLCGFRLFPYIIINAYNIMYDIPKALTPFSVPYALFSSLTAIVCTLAATLSACWAELREAPARLMLPKAPKAGKRVFLEYITPLWSRMKFTRKVTARNLIRYKKRFFMTVIGIAGCTALLVTGFGIKDSISPIVSLQYDDLNQYQLMVMLSDESALEGRDLQAILQDEGQVTGYLPVLQDEGKMVPKTGDPEDTVAIFAPSDVSALPDYFRFRHRTDSDEVVFDENAVIITEKLSERQHLKVGDTITVKNQDEKEASFTITDICENYVAHTLYISPAAYEEAFDQPAESNVLLCKLAEDIDEDALSTELLACRDVATLRFTEELSESFGNSIKSIDSITVVLIISAGALAFVVLYNLTNINISERIKEIATIKVLGFYDGEVSAYIYRENAVLTIIGDAVGLILGIFLHQFVIRTAEIDLVMFGRSLHPLCFVWATLLTILFSVLVNLVMHRKLKKISMVESMKAPE